MKKNLCLLLSLALLLTLVGCGKESVRVPGEFYYRRTATVYGTENGVIAPEVRELASIESDPEAILDLYLKGPVSIGLESPFPRDSRVENWQIQDRTLVLTMNEAFTAISGVELTIACVCITRTMLGILDVDQVRFLSEDTLLNGQKELTLSADLISLTDDSLDQAWEEYQIYYTDRQMRYLIAQDISVNLATENDVVGFLFEALSRPPMNSGLLSAVPPGTDLLGYVIDDGVCTVNLSGEFEYNGWKTTEAQRLSLLCVANTLTQLAGIRQVEFAVDGNLVVQYRSVSITAPLEFDEAAIGPVRTGMNEFDATLYLANSAEPYLSPVPTRLRQSSGKSEAELIVNAILEHESHNGFYSTIPGNTRLNFVTVSEGICHVDLSAEFLSDQANLVRSVRSIVASLCTLEYVQGVLISVDGNIPEGSNPELFQILTPQPDWYI